MRRLRARQGHSASRSWRALGAALAVAGAAAVAALALRGGVEALCAGDLPAPRPAASYAEAAGVSRREEPLETTIQDDALLLYGPDRAVGGTARAMAAAGADRARITALWSALAPSPQSATRPPFDAGDSRQYPAEPWERLDRAVRAATDAGLEVQLDAAFWAPRWAVERQLPPHAPGDPETRQRWRPSAREYGRFVEALARRYGGRFPDPRRPGRPLPAVHLWTTWNEPNHQVFLLPQRLYEGGRSRAASPHVYRALHEAGYRALKRLTPRSEVLIGGTAALSGPPPGPQRGLTPLEFVRGLACVDRELRPLRMPECRHFRPLEADGYAHHPYALLTPPDQSDPEPDDVPLADLDRLAALLRELHRRGRLASELPLYLTEFGYETDPPDFGRGFPPERHARYLGQATFLAWKRRDTRMFAQFLLRDEPPNLRYPASSPRRWQGLQTGLLTNTGRPKPALRAFRLPFWAELDLVAQRPVALAFGQVRPGTGPQRVVLEAQEEDGSWRPVRSLDARAPGGATCAEQPAEFRTDRRGFYLRALAVDRAAPLRARWRAGRNGERADAVTVAVEPSLPAQDRLLPLGSLPMHDAGPSAQNTGVSE